VLSEKVPPLLEDHVAEVAAPPKLPFKVIEWPAHTLVDGPALAEAPGLMVTVTLSEELQVPPLETAR